MIYCGECGTPNPDPKKYCLSCGKPLTTFPNPSIEQPIAPTYAAKLKVLGRDTTDEEFNQNYFRELGELGTIIGEFILVTSSHFKAVLDAAKAGDKPTLKRENGDLFRLLNFYSDKILRLKVPRDFEPMRSNASSFLKETILSSDLFAESIVRNDGLRMQRAEQHMNARDHFKADLDASLRAYNQARGKKCCENCNTWVGSAETICSTCGRDFTEAERLGLIHLFSLQIDYYLDQHDSQFLDSKFTYQHPPGPPDVGHAIISFIDYVISHLTSRTRDLLIPKLNVIRTDMDRMWNTKTFSWPDVPKLPSKSAKCQVSFTIHSVARRPEQPQFDTLVDIAPPTYDLTSAGNMLPLIVKWFPTYGNMRPADAMFFLTLFAGGLQDRWIPHSFDESSSDWINSMMKAATMLKTR